MSVAGSLSGSVSQNNTIISNTHIHTLICVNTYLVRQGVLDTVLVSLGEYFVSQLSLLSSGYPLTLHSIYNMYT